MGKALLNGVQIHYQQAGSGPDVVLVHGLSGDLSLWYVKFIPELAKSYRATAFDLRGHGLSDRPATGYAPTDLAADLKALLDYLGVEQTFLVGHSFGGVVAMAFASLHPDRVRGVVIYDTGFPFLRRLHDYENWSGWEKWKPMLEELGITKETDYFDPEILVPKLANISLPFGLRAGRRRIGRRVMKLLRETTVFKDFWQPSEFTEERLLAISVPVLAVYGAESPVSFVGRHLAENLPNCQLVRVEGEDHFFVLQEPRQFLRLVTQFLDRVVNEQEGGGITERSAPGQAPAADRVSDSPQA